MRGDDPGIAGSIAAAQAAYGRLRPDVILMDHNLPDGTGLELLKRIRAQDRRTKIVMMTAHGACRSPSTRCSPAPTAPSRRCANIPGQATSASCATLWSRRCCPPSARSSRPAT